MASAGEETPGALTGYGHAGPGAGGQSRATSGISPGRLSGLEELLQQMRGEGPEALSSCLVSAWARGQSSPCPSGEKCGDEGHRDRGLEGTRGNTEFGTHSLGPMA